MSGTEDLALSLPSRAEGDRRIRVGLVHGSTFDLPGHQTNFPSARDATAQRGLDYLAVGDTHGYREIPENAIAPIVYPGSPEPTSFGDVGAGSVVIVTLKRAGTRPLLVREPVARWTWRDETATSMETLRRLASEDLERVSRSRLRHTRDRCFCPLGSWWIVGTRPRVLARGLPTITRARRERALRGGVPLREAR